MFEDQIESSTDDPNSGDSTPQDSGDNFVEPRPEDYGISLGTDSCLDECWANFNRCIRNSMNSAECIAQLETCKRACAEKADAGAAPTE